MNSPLIISDENSREKIKDLKISNVTSIEEVTILNPLSHSQNFAISEENTRNHFEQKKFIDDTDDSFEIFLPLSVKNSSKLLKNSKCAASPNKAKKKKITNRICPYFTARKTSKSSKEDKDLQLALARSLTDALHTELSDDILKPVINDKKLSKQNSDFLKSLTSKSKKAGVNSLLFRRTREERQNILTKKVAIVLVGKENFNDECFQKREIELISSVLEGCWDKNSTLWERSKTDVNNLADFYVTTLEKFIERPLTLDMSNADVKDDEYSKGLLTIMNTKGVNNDYDLKDHEPNNEEKVYYQELNHCDFNKCPSSNKNELITDSLNLLSDDFSKIFGNGKLSDIKVILKTGEIIPCHKLILHIRCPSLLVSRDFSEASSTLDFTQYSAKSAQAFLKYIYGGKIELIYELSSEDKNDLYVLAKKYDVQFIEEFVLTAFSSDSFHLYSQSTCSPPNSSPSSPGSTHSSKKKIEFSRIHSFSHNSNSEENYFPAFTKQNQTVKVSEVDKDSQNDQPSCSFSWSSKKDHGSVSFLIDDNSTYDIFKDDIKSPCNSSVLTRNISLTKRKLDYSNIICESKKLCSENYMNKSPEIVNLDSDSNDEYLNIQRNISDSSNLPPTLNEAIPAMNELSSDNGSNSFDLNITNYYSNVNVNNEVSNEQLGIESIQQAANSSKISSTSAQSLPPLIKKVSSNYERSFDKYFEASFPDINENIDNVEAPCKPIISSTPVTPVLSSTLQTALTPLQEIIINDATPKPDYASMISPELKVELRKYGIKPDLDHKKARVLLRYIYDQIHPSTCELPRYKSPLPSTSKERISPIIVIDDDSDHSEPEDTRVDSKNDFAYEEYLFNCSKEWNENTPNQDESNLKKTIVKFIKSEAELFSNVVLFRPLLLKTFHRTLKEHGIQCSVHELLDVLDELGINYHVEKTETRKKRQHRRKLLKRKPPKKTNI